MISSVKTRCDILQQHDCCVFCQSKIWRNCIWIDAADSKDSSPTNNAHVTKKT